MSRETVIQILVLCWLATVYVWLWGDISIGNIVAGLLIGLLVMSSLRLPRVRVEGSVHVLSIVKLLSLTVYYALESSAQVAWLAIRPGPLPPAGVLRIRLLIARAIVTRPRLLVIDECLATVEPRARRELVAALTGPGATWTLIAVSHAPDLLAACDRVLVLRDGTRHALAPWATLAEDPFVRALVPDARSAA